MTLSTGHRSAPSWAQCGPKRGPISLLAEWTMKTGLWLVVSCICSLRNRRAVLATDCCVCFHRLSLCILALCQRLDLFLRRLGHLLERDGVLLFGRIRTRINKETSRRMAVRSLDSGRFFRRSNMCGNAHAVLKTVRDSRVAFPVLPVSSDWYFIAGQTPPLFRPPVRGAGFACPYRRHSSGGRERNVQSTGRSFAARAIWPGGVSAYRHPSSTSKSPS